MANSFVASIGVDVTATSTTANFELGTEAFVNGNRYRYMTAVTAVAAGDAVVQNTANANEPNAIDPASAVNQPLIGVAPVAIAAGSYGWIVVSGKVASAKLATGTTAGSQLGTSATAGTLSAITVSATPTQAEIQRVLAAASGKAVIAVDAEAAGVGEVFVI